MLSTKSSNLLNSFVVRAIGFDALWEQLAEAEYDDSLPLEERDTLASIRLLAIEIDEGLREMDDLRQAIQTLLCIESIISYEFTARLITTGSTSLTSDIAEKLGSVVSGITDVRIQPVGAS